MELWTFNSASCPETVGTQHLVHAWYMQQSQDAQIMRMCFLNIIWFCRTCWSFHPFNNYPLDAKIKEETCFWKSILCRSVFICIIRLGRWKKRFLESPFAREISIIKTPHLSTIHVYSLKGEDPLIFMMAAPYRVSTYQTLFSKRGALFLCISCVFSLSLFLQHQLSNFLHFQ